MTPISPNSAGRAATSSAVGSGELLAIARELTFAAGRRDATVLITVDQAEELSGSVSLEIGKTFLQFLGASLSTGDRHLMAIGTLRSDFLGIFQDQVALLGPAYRLGLNHLSITVEPIPLNAMRTLLKGLQTAPALFLKAAWFRGCSRMPASLIHFPCWRLYSGGL